MIVLYFLIAVIVLITLVKNEGDEGEQYVFLGVSLSYFVMSYFIMSESHYLTPGWAADKYETSGLSQLSQALLNKISGALDHESFYLKAECTLANLSMRLSVHPNYISQAINQEYGHKFRDHINSRRVTEAQSRLSDPAYANYTISSIGESVGFNSKPAFYAAFKKHVGVTPAIFQEKQLKS